MAPAEKVVVVKRSIPWPPPSNCGEGHDRYNPSCLTKMPTPTPSGLHPNPTKIPTVFSGRFPNSTGVTVQRVNAPSAPAAAPDTTTPYGGNQFQYDARSMGFAIGILILIGVFFGWLLVADIRSGKYRFKKMLRRGRAPRSGNSGAGSILPSFMKRGQQQSAQQPMEQRTQSAAGTAATGTSAATATVVATSSSGASASNSGDRPFEAANGSRGSGSEGAGETTTATTSRTIVPSSSSGTHSDGIPAVTNGNGTPRAPAPVAVAPTAPSFRRSTPPRLPTPNGVPSEDGEKRKSSHSLGKAVFGVFSRNGSASQV